VWPHFQERPVLKFGTPLVQLPWIVGMQNNSTAAINNLRRVGARRGQVRDETQRIEAALAQLLESRGFKTLLKWNPPLGDDDPGEVDVIATLGSHLLVLEVKSTFLRRSQRGAWLHATGTPCAGLDVSFGAKSTPPRGPSLRMPSSATSLAWPSTCCRAITMVGSSTPASSATASV